MLYTGTSWVLTTALISLLGVVHADGSVGMTNPLTIEHAASELTPAVQLKNQTTWEVAGTGIYYRKLPTGQVVVQFRSGVSLTSGTLPTGYRPAINLNFPMPESTNVVSIFSGGSVGFGASPLTLTTAIEYSFFADGS